MATVCVMRSDASAKSFTRPVDSVSPKGEKFVLVMKENLWENNLNFVNDVTMIYVKFTTYVITAFEGGGGGKGGR